ncbi:MAG: 6-phospho-beta-glucosidase [Deltaproteobacteria bacterium]|nr:6-phospho-beta-glucosidase [Deltaproteobacteria bacterium]MCB9488725.1 6-phospho-beta-glucosidase [Deltaproteobacteria bacterium]
MKIAIIGGGSTYTPEVIEGFINNEADLGLTEVVLMDIDPERLGIVGAFAKRMVEHAGGKFKVKTTLDRGEAIDGASFVLTQFRVGHQRARHADIMLGLRHDLIGQETTGIGGMAKALRTIPHILDICTDIEKTAPDAWVINFTNPAGIITEAILNQTGVKHAIGLCNVPIEMKMVIAKHMGVEEKDVFMESVGLNHLGWVRRVEVQGVDVMPKLLEFLSSEEGPANIPDVDFAPELITSLEAVPLYYNRFFYNTPSVLAGLKAKKKSRAQEVMDIERALLAKYQDESVVTKPEELDLRGGAYYSKIAVEVIHAVAQDTGAEHIVNTHNNGAMPDLPDNAVVEVRCKIGKDGAVTQPTAPMEPSIRGLIQVVKAYEQLVVEAAVNQSRAAAFRALITNPLGPKAENATKVLDDLLATNGLEYS